MMCDRDDLETERQHVRCKSRLDDFGRIDALLAEMCEALLKEAADGAENLEVVGDSCVVERKGHGVSSHHVVCFLGAIQFPEFPPIAIGRGGNRRAVRRWAAGDARIPLSVEKLPRLMIDQGLQPSSLIICPPARSNPDRRSGFRSDPAWAEDSGVV